MDGVIFDSEQRYIECCEAMADKYNIDNVVGLCRKCIGITPQETKRIVLSCLGQDFPVEEYRADVRKVLLKRYAEEGLPLKSGVREILSYFRDEGCRIAVASSTPTEDVKRELQDAELMGYFDAVIGGDQVSKSKPEPDIFLKAAEKIGADPVDCVVIEDSFNGIRAAHAAGAFAVMVPDLLEPDDEMREKADLIVPGLNEAKEFFEKEN